HLCLHAYPYATNPGAVTRLTRVLLERDSPVRQCSSRRISTRPVVKRIGLPLQVWFTPRLIQEWSRLSLGRGCRPARLSAAVVEPTGSATQSSYRNRSVGTPCRRRPSTTRLCCVHLAANTPGEYWVIRSAL